MTMIHIPLSIAELKAAGVTDEEIAYMRKSKANQERLKATRPHVDAEDGLVRGDYAILKLALEHAEAECARLRGLIAALPCRLTNGRRDATGRLCADVWPTERAYWCPGCIAKEAARG